MKLAIVTQTFWPEFNGVVTAIGNIACEMSKRGHDVCVIHPYNDTGQKQESEENSIKLFRVHGFTLPIYPGFYYGLPVYHSIKKICRKNNIDVIHIATECPLGLAALFAARNLKIPVSSSFHTNFHSFVKFYSFVRKLSSLIFNYLKWFHNQTDITLVPSVTSKNILEERGFVNLSILARGVDTTFFTPDRCSKKLREKWAETSKSVVILCVGRIAPEKNFELAFKAYRKIKSETTDVQLVVVGDGPLLNTLRHKNPDVIFTGKLRGEPLAECYASADIFIFSSKTDTFGNVVAEAMASGLIVVGYDYASIRDLVENEHNGYAIPFDNEHEFIQTLNKVVQEKVSWPGIRENARKTCVNMDWGKIACQFENYLFSVQ